MKAIRTAVLLALMCAPLICIALPATAADSYKLSNGLIAAQIDARGLESITDLSLGKMVEFWSHGHRVQMDEYYIETAAMKPIGVKADSTSITFTYKHADAVDFDVIYELKPGWRFVTCQVSFAHTSRDQFHIKEILLFCANIKSTIAYETRIDRGATGSWASLLRFARSKDNEPDYGCFFLIQNPYMKWYYQYGGANLSYEPNMDWKREYGRFVSDRACIGIYQLSETMCPAKSRSESLYLQNPDKALEWSEKLDSAEIQALRECVSRFMTWKPEKSIRIDVGWCANDFQIDVGTPRGRTEYKRIIDRAAEMGCGYIIYTPANSQVSDRKESRDAWGWEHILWLGLGQKIRKDEWDPNKDTIPSSIEEMLDYAKSKHVGLVAYVYPTMPWMQNLEWTTWCKNEPGGYAGPDNGVRSWQDWFIKKLVDFQKKTGIAGYSFDLWYLEGGTSEYAQWQGMKRILDELRRQVPGIIIDGRQTMCGYGPWTATSGCYPHPFGWDEQPGSFGATADLHTDRLSANHTRWANWTFAMRSFFPVDVMPGFIGHQTQRGDDKGLHHDTFRPRDWDYLGWRYSLFSSIATAPFIHVFNMLPARDESEFKCFSDADKKWLNGWLDWTDANKDILRNIRPIIGPPMIGRVDGTAAFKGDHGYVFLFNPNYRRMDANFKLDSSIGLNAAGEFIITQLYPREGLALGNPQTAFWKSGGKVTLTMEGTSCMVLEVKKAPPVTGPVLFNATGKASLDGNTLAMSGVSGEIGAQVQVTAALPPGAKAKSVTLNGKPVKFAQQGQVVRTDVRFAGVQFSHSRQIGSYDRRFDGRACKWDFSIPERIFTQLKARGKAWPIPYTEDDLKASWLGPDRLLLVVAIAGANPKMQVTMKIDGKPVEMKQAWNGIYPSAGDGTFIGNYVDISNLKPQTRHQVEVTLPKLDPGQFQGLFFENVETEYTQEIARS